MRYGRQFVANNHDKMNQLVTLFKQGVKRKRRFGNFVLDEAGTLTYTSVETEGYGDKKTQTKSTDIVAISLKDQNILLGNSAVLPNVGSYVAYGNKKHNREQTLIQRLLEQEGIAMIPFNAVEQAGLNVKDIVVLDQTAAEKVKIKLSKYDHALRKDVEYIEERHFTGSTLFKVGEVHFLFDVDRREVEHNIFNPFIVQLPKAVNTIADAYLSLKPDAVLSAEKEGKEVLRQGEWFFIESEAPSIPTVSALERLAIAGLNNTWRNEALFAEIGETEKARLEALRDALPRQLSLRVNNNRPNNAEKGLQLNGTTYVTGSVTHTGREHAPLVLTKWYTAIPNTATKSFTVTGDID